MVVVSQTSVFLDRRTGVTNIPMSNSGYTVSRRVFEKKGIWSLETIKMGAKVTANGYSSAAAGGGLTEVDKTQTP